MIKAGHESMVQKYKFTFENIFVGRYPARISPTCKVPARETPSNRKSHVMYLKTTHNTCHTFTYVAIHDCGHNAR